MGPSIYNFSSVKINPMNRTIQVLREMNIFLKEELIKYVVRKALSLSTDDFELRSIVGTTRYVVMKYVVNSISEKLVSEKNNHLRCGLCGKGPFTKRGLFLHLLRIHKADIIEMLDKKYREVDQETSSSSA